jgi:hypothetical protein
MANPDHVAMRSTHTLPSAARLLLVIAAASSFGFAAGAWPPSPSASDTTVPGPGTDNARLSGTGRDLLCGASVPKHGNHLRFESMSLAELEATAVDADARPVSEDRRIR